MVWARAVKVEGEGVKITGAGELPSVAGLLQAFDKSPRLLKGS